MNTHTHHHNLKAVRQRIRRNAALLLITAAMAALFTACARMGQPDGGWYDEEPPHIVGTSPAEMSTGVKGNKITIYFDEYIKLDNPSENVVVSPPQQEQPEIKGQGKRITVELLDTLKENTTYTIDFSDAISDNNEGNPLGNYTYTFSTGSSIDTLEVAGYVLEAADLEPVKGILVGLYHDNDTTDSDTLFLTAPFERVSRTDDRGRFVIRGIAPGTYQVFALQDADNDYHLSQKSEKLAFMRDLVVPECRPDIRQDTIWRDSLHISDILQVPYTHFLPDNLVLTAFTEQLTDRYLVKSERENADRFSLIYSYGHKERPIVSALNFNSDDALLVESSVNQDTLTYWLRDTTLVNQDTLRIAVSHFITDTLGVLNQQSDTLELISRHPYEKRMKAKQDAYEKWKKQQERNEKRGRHFETQMKPEMLEPEYNVPANIDPDQNPYIVMPTPLEHIDTAAIHLYQKQDTLWYRTNFLFGEKPGRPRTYHIIGEWTPGAEYSLEIDSAAFTDIYHKTSEKYKKGFKVRRDDEFSTLTMTITGFERKNIVVQMLNASDKVVKETATSNGTATFYYVKPDTYYIRMFVDDNDNGLWDTGLYSERRQAEAVYYYPGKIECRAKWDVSQTWNPTQQPLYRQKPGNIQQKKKEKKRVTTGKNEKRARDMGIEYVKKTTVMP